MNITTKYKETYYLLGVITIKRIYVCFEKSEN